MPTLAAEPDQVFLNIPYDARFERLYLAYIAGVTGLALKPQATLAIPGGTARHLNGTDFNIHDGTVEGVMRELCNAFVRVAERPTVPEMVADYREFRRSVPQVLNCSCANSVFEARVFDELCAAASLIRLLRTRR